MNWINSTKAWIVEKLNPAQDIISRQQGTYIGSDSKLSYKAAFDNLESVNRGVSMIVNACSSLDYDIKDKLVEGIVSGSRLKNLNQLLNYRPNPYQSAEDFRKNIFTDFVLEGNAFIYYDGTFLYHLPANQMVILTDPKTYISGYKYAGMTNFLPEEIISFKDITSNSIYRGSSRLASAQTSMNILYSMQQFQENFFNNGAVFGTVLTTENTLSQTAKDKTINNWIQKYSPKQGGRRPLILDSGLKPFSLNVATFKDMDFDESIATHNTQIMQALGVPPILLEGGNNANISPNLRLFYLETVMPIVRSYMSALERYFGYDIDAITTNVSALQPELKDIAAYHSTLVNAGILTPNEARIELRYPKILGNDDLRIPANIAGSAADPSVGGAPPKPKPAEPTPPKK